MFAASAGTIPFERYTDAESGLQYLRARYDDPATQQFLTFDPLAGLPNGHPYAFAADDPLNFTDPWSLCQWYEPYAVARAARQVPACELEGRTVESLSNQDRRRPLSNLCHGR